MPSLKLKGGMDSPTYVLEVVEGKLVWTAVPTYKHSIISSDQTSGNDHFGTTECLL